MPDKLFFSPKHSLFRLKLTILPCIGLILSHSSLTTELNSDRGIGFLKKTRKEVFLQSLIASTIAFSNSSKLKAFSKLSKNLLDYHFDQNLYNYASYQNYL